MSKKFNVDKLNMEKIKKEISFVPNLIKKKSKIGYRSITSVNNSRYNNSLSKELNANFLLTPIISSSSYLEKKKEINSHMIKSNSLTNFQPEIKIESIRLDENNNNEDDYIIKLIKAYENKIKEISNIYENKLQNLEKSYQLLLKNIQTSSNTYITLIEHNYIINNLNLKWENRISSLKTQYEKQISNLTDIMKYKEKYRGLINRMEKYRKYEIDIQKIEEKLIENKIENNKQTDFSFDLYLVSKLSQEIEYNKSLFDLNMIYSENLEKLNFENMQKFSNLSTKVTQIFDNLIGLENNEESKELILIPNQNDCFSYEKQIKNTKSNQSKNVSSSESLNSKSFNNKSSILSLESLNLTEISHQKPNNISTIIPLTKTYEENIQIESNNNSNKKN